MSTIIERQNEVIIALLARSTIGVDYIEKIVTSRKKGKGEDFLRAYNQLDGTRSITEIAKQLGVSKQNISQVLQAWEEKGIVYNVGTTSRSVYAGLLKLPTKNKPRATSQQTKVRRKQKTPKTRIHTKELPSVAAQDELTTLPIKDVNQPQ